jgi:hypothetical protein
MKRTPLSAMTVAQLVDLFARNCDEQDKADLEGNMAKYRRLFQGMKEIHDELKSRLGDQRRELIALFNYPNMQVRLQAAKLTLAVSPLEARSQLEAIVASKWMPQAGDAGMCIHNLDTGFYKPE